MIDALLSRTRRKRQFAAEKLMDRLSEKASLVVDDRLVADLGVGRKTLYRIIYDMVRRERMFMLADNCDQMLLMTNAEFHRFLFRRSGKKAFPKSARAGGEDSDILLEGPLPAAEKGMDDSTELLPEEDWEIPAAALDSTLYAFPAAAEDAPAAAPGAFDWFSIDVAPCDGDAGAVRDLPEQRQSLPERKRDPWAPLENIGQD